MTIRPPAAAITLALVAVAGFVLGVIIGLRLGVRLMTNALER